MPALPNAIRTARLGRLLPPEDFVTQEVAELRSRPTGQSRRFWRGRRRRGAARRVCARFLPLSANGAFRSPRSAFSNRAPSVSSGRSAGKRGRLRKAWLSYQAHALPLLESAAALTSAKIDLLPHQVVLTHRVATCVAAAVPDRR